MTNVVVEGCDLGSGVMFAEHRQDARLAGSNGMVQERLGLTLVWAAGLIDQRCGARSIVDERSEPPPRRKWQGDEMGPLLRPRPSVRRPRPRTRGRLQEMSAHV